MAAITVARSGLPVVGAVVDDIKISSDQEMADLHFSDGAWVPVHLTPANFGRQMTAAERIACRYLFARSDVREIQTLQRLVTTIMTVARDAVKYIDNAPDSPVQLEWYDQVSHQLEEVILDARMISNTIPGLKKEVLRKLHERGKEQRSEGAWARHRIAATGPLNILHEPRKGYSFLVEGGDIDELARELNRNMVIHVPAPMDVPKVRGAVKAFWFSWSNGQAAWDATPWKDFPWHLDGAGFFVFCGQKALSPLGRPWTAAEMNYVAKKLAPHPGYASSPESAAGRRRWASLLADKIPGGLSEKKDLKDFDPKALAKGQKVEMEHTTDPEIAREITRDHLTEDPDYYEKLERMEAGKCDKKARLTLAERAEFTRALHADATALIRAFKPRAAAFGITQKIKDEIDLLLRQYKGAPVPDSKVHAIAEGAGVPVDEVESYVYFIASKRVTEHEPATERVARLYLRQAAGGR